MGYPITKNKMIDGGDEWVVGGTLTIEAAAVVTVAGGATITGLTGGETTFATAAQIEAGTEAAKSIAPDQLKIALQALPYPLITAQTIATAALGTVRQVHGQLTASHAHIASGTIAGVRGLITLSGVNDTGGAYFYGAQGKLVVTGTLGHADSRACALIAQLDATGGVLSAGELSGLWIDAVGVSGQPFEEFNAIRISSNKDLKYQALLYAQSDAAYFTSLVKPTGGALSCVATAGTGDGSAGYAGGHEADAVLKILINDGTHNGIYYIPLFDQNT
jgi:hypothetical protein